jgi:recombination protein RecA
VLAYANAIKARLLGVPGRMLARYGAVSGPVARRMAEGVRKLCGADLGLAVTGIAGPDGGTPLKPVGLVFVGVAGKGKTRVRRFRFSGNRNQVKRQSSEAALEWLKTFLGRENSMAKKELTKEDAQNTDKEKSGKAASLDTVLAQIRKQFGEGAIMRLGEVDLAKDIPVVSTGAYSLDLALGVGGLPRGRVIEIFGPESSGKTTLTLHVIANAQKSGGMAAFVDAEHAMDPGYAKKIGVNTNDLLISQPASGEEALSIVESLVKSSALDVVVVDSVAALTPRAELEGDMGDSHMGLQARLMSQAMRKLTAAISHSKTLVIFTNQIREKIGVMFGNPETTPGGRALKFYTSVRLNIRRIAEIKDAAGTMVGNRTRVKVVKNKVAPPFTEAEFDILYAKGISWEGSVLEAGLKYGAVQKKGSWLAFEGEQVGQGMDASRIYLEGNPDLTARIIAKVKEKVLAGATPEAKE